MFWWTNFIQWKFMTKRRRRKMEAVKDCPQLSESADIQSCWAVLPSPFLPLIVRISAKVNLSIVFSGKVLHRAWLSETKLYSISQTPLAILFFLNYPHPTTSIFTFLNPWFVQIVGARVLEVMCSVTTVCLVQGKSHFPFLLQLVEFSETTRFLPFWIH